MAAKKNGSKYLGKGMAKKAAKAISTRKKQTAGPLKCAAKGKEYSRKTKKCT